MILLLSGLNLRGIVFVEVSTPLQFVHSLVGNHYRAVGNLELPIHILTPFCPKMAHSDIHHLPAQCMPSPFWIHLLLLQMYCRLAHNWQFLQCMETPSLCWQIFQQDHFYANLHSLDGRQEYEMLACSNIRYLSLFDTFPYSQNSCWRSVYMSKIWHLLTAWCELACLCELFYIADGCSV